MPKNQLSHHDRFTRSLMSHPKVVEEFFRENLPEKIKSNLDFSSIEFRRESFIDDNLKLKIVDMLFEAKFDGQPGFFYLLFEHASKSHTMLPFRILNYIVAIMNNHVKITEKNELPFVYPMILYSGKRPYRGSMDIFDLFPDNERQLARDTLLTPYHLIDLTQISDKELQANLHYGTMARTLKHVHDKCINPYFNELIEDLKRLAILKKQLYLSVIEYVTLAAKTSNKNEFNQSIRNLESPEEEKLMTIAELYKQEGREEGREEEREVIAKTLLAEGMQVNKVAALTGLSQERVKELSY